MKEIILALIASGFFSALVSGGVALLNNRKAKTEDLHKQMDAQSAAIRALARDRIKDNCKRHIADGHLTSDDLEDILSMHEAYHNLGGNGFCDALINQVKKLPIRN